ncbi:hypothetical protein [Nakamurella leprariae]|uniref:DUF4437 domain-containing protein n=1 Tax=Nakamurella leprariae TaxID=2803911 RepID=A0A939C0X0_9ACTN|nr:hypothetical protein [Nakamurella leprariae]MBM9466479.1 hypothetical protein [Nakamurella leprariae]
MWNRPDVDFIQSQDVPFELVPAGQFGAVAGGRRQLLSRDPSDGAETAIHRLADRVDGALADDVDLFVLAGDGTLNGNPLATGDYVHLPAGAAFEIVPSVRRLTVYCGFWGTPELTAAARSAAPITHTNPERDLQWVPAGWSSGSPLEPGALSKVLRADDRAFIYLAAMVPGWKSPNEESHPQYEESFKIYGDVLMGRLGVMQPGSYFFRSPDVFHGPLYSRGGTMSFIRSDAPTTTTYRTPDDAGSWQSLSARAYA